MINFKWLVVFVSLNICEICYGREIHQKEAMILCEKVAHQDEWPWLAKLIQTRSRKVFCDGTVVSPKSVLTAAHCLQPKKSATGVKINELDVQLGELDPSCISSKVNTVRPTVIVIHPDWDTFSERFDADLGLLIFENDLASKSVIPVCLWKDFKTLPGDIVDGIVGTFNRVQAKKLTPEDCFLENPSLALLASRRTFCATELTDQGSGFFIQVEGICYIQGIAAVKSQSDNCSVSKISVFTDLNDFDAWIRQGISKLYTMPLKYESSKKHDHHGKLYVTKELTVLQTGAFLTLTGKPFDHEVIQLKIKDQNVRHFPNNLGRLFPSLETLSCVKSHVKFLERTNFKDMSHLWSLDLSSNLIEQVPVDSFYDLTKVKEIFLKDNKLKVLNANTFIKNFKLLRYSSNRNQIESIERGSFRKNSELMKISFSNNKIKKIENQSFGKMLKLEVLDLSNNMLESIPDDAFISMANLIFLDFSNNKVKFLHRNSFVNNTNVQTIHANDNLIETLEEGIFSNKTELRIAYFQNNRISKIFCRFRNNGDTLLNLQNNTCIDKQYYIESYHDAVEMIEDFKEKC